MIRVLHIGMSYDYGGIESFIINYYRDIDKSTIQFDFINNYDKPLAYSNEILKMGGKIYNISDFHMKPLTYRKELQNIMQNYNTVHIHMLSASNLIPVKIAKKVGVDNIIVHSHNTKPEGAFRAILHTMNYKKIVKYADIFLACSEEAGKWMYGKNVKFQVIRNAIDIDKYAFNNKSRKKIRKELHLKNDDVLYGNVGRLNVQKNQKFLLKVFAEIEKENRNSHLCIVGIGEQEENLKNLASNLGIENKVIFMGKRFDLDEIYSGMDCFIMTSLYEGLPLTLVEAQANGLKCFVSKGNVPYESKVIDTLEFIPLKKGEKEWANIIKNSDKTRLANSTEMLYENHFGIRDEIQGLEKIYLCSAN